MSDTLTITGYQSDWVLDDLTVVAGFGLFIYLVWMIRQMYKAIREILADDPVPETEAEEDGHQNVHSSPQQVIVTISGSQDGPLNQQQGEPHKSEPQETSV